MRYKNVTTSTAILIFAALLLGACAPDEQAALSDPRVASLATTVTYLDTELTPDMVVKMYGLSGPTAVISEADVKASLIRVGVSEEDAKIASSNWLEMNKYSFVPSSDRRQALVDAGLDFGVVAMTVENFLEYLRIAFGFLPPGSGAPATLEMLQIHLYIQQNGVPNIRTPGPDRPLENKWTLHRETLANQRIFKAVAALAGLKQWPLQQVTVDRATLALMLGGDDAGAALYTTLTGWGIHSVIANTSVHQYAGHPQGFPIGGKIVDADLIWFLEQTDPKMYASLSDIQLDSAVTGEQVERMVDVTCSWKRPGDGVVTVAELQDFFIAFGNALPNKPNALFAPLVHPDDFDALEQAARQGLISDNPEFDHQRQLFRRMAIIASVSSP